MLVVTGNQVFLTRGDTLVLTLSLSNADGTPYVPAEGDSIFFRLKKFATYPTLLIEKQIDISTMILQLDEADTAGLAYFCGNIKAKLNAITAQLPSTISGYDISGKSGSMELWSQNLNNITVSGFYNAITCTNAPYQYATLIVVGYYLEGYCTQIITDVTSGKMMRRSQINWSWSAWSAM